jgi:hypothetical protein
MTSFLSASNLSKTATNNSSRIVSSNSIYGVLSLADTVFKLESTNDYAIIQISVKSTKAVNVLVQQAFDNVVLEGGGVPSLVSTQSIAVVPEDPLNGGTPALTFYASITFPFFRIVLINTAEQVGNVYLTTKLITAITPDDDGFLAYGSANGTDPIVLKTNSAGNISLKNVNPAYDEYTANINGDENIVISQRENGVMKIQSVDGVVTTNNTLADIYTSTVVNTANSTESLINFFSNIFNSTTYETINAGDVIFGSSVDTQNIYTVSMMGQFLNNSENPPDGYLELFIFTRLNPANDIFSIQSNLGLNAFAGKTIYPNNINSSSPATLTVSNPGDSGMTIGYMSSTNQNLKLSFNISTPFNASNYSLLRFSSLSFTTAFVTYSGSVTFVTATVLSIISTRVTLELTVIQDPNFPSPTLQYNVTSLSFIVTGNNGFIPSTTLINSSSASSGGYCAVNTAPVNLTTAGNSITQVRGSTLYVFTPTIQVFVTTPPVYDITDQLAFEYSNDNTNWIGGATVPDFSLLAETLTPIANQVPYSRLIYNLSIQTPYIFARYVRIKAVKKMLLRRNYQILGQKILPNPLRLI